MLKIRLRRVGAKKQPSYRLVVADSRAARDGRFVETIGHYNPRTEPPTAVVYEDRALYWLSQGAQPSEAVGRFFEKLGLAAKVKQIHAGATIESVAAPRPSREPAAAESRARRRPGAAESAPAAAEQTAEAAPTPAAPAAGAEESPAPMPSGTVGETESSTVAAASDLESLGLTARVAKALEDAGISTVAGLAAKLAEGEDHLIALPGIGAKAVEEIRAKLAEHGI